MYLVEAYTDGSCIDNPGPGGLGVYLRRLDRKTKNVKKLSYSFKHSTSNEMELMAILLALLGVSKPCHMTIYTDSQYSIDCIFKWHVGWAKKGWKTAEGKPVKNAEVIKRIIEMCKFHTVTLIKVKGHSGIAGNEKADAMARKASAKVVSKQAELYTTKYWYKKVDEFILKKQKQFSPTIRDAMAHSQ